MTQALRGEGKALHEVSGWAPSQPLQDLVRILRIGQHVDERLQGRRHALSVHEE
ncbi:hypothetical protein ACFWMU_32170 [Streptomyces sp. NPDC058357]|uniref:hypothetical protein n=1 Tax=unclassified Streptomyces TaxID=2593676 RepID=UPI00365FF3E0